MRLRRLPAVQVAHLISKRIKSIWVACRTGDREIVYKEIKHLTMLKDVKQVVQIFEVFEQDQSDIHIVMEVRLR